MRMNKWAPLLSVILVMSLLSAGCFSGESPEGQSSESESPSPAQGQTDAPGETEPVKVTVFHTDNTVNYPTGRTVDHPWFNYLMEKTGVEFEGVFLPHGQYADQMRVRLASGERPDVIMHGQLSIVEEILGDSPLELNELIDEFGPNLKKNIPQAAWDAVSKNGKIYAIPGFTRFKTNNAFLVRKDWMDQAGVGKMPETVDEFLDLLRAFRDHDPAGNGETIPLSIRENLSWGENIFGMYGFSRRGYTFMDGKYVPNVLHPRMKDVISLFATMYNEGLIDSEFLTLKGPTWQQKIFSNKVGMWNHQSSAVVSFNDGIADANPDLVPAPETVVMPTPRAPGVTGPVGSVDEPITILYAVTKYAKNPEAVVRMFDWMASEEGQAATWLGLPGVTYTNENGVYTYDAEKDEEIGDIRWRKVFYRVAPSDAIAAAFYDEELLRKLDAAKAVIDNEGLPFDKTPVFPALVQNPDLGVGGLLFMEMFARIVLDGYPLDEYDKFVETWRKQGGDELIEQATAWYSENME